MPVTRYERHLTATSAEYPEVQLSATRLQQAGEELARYYRWDHWETVPPDSPDKDAPGVFKVYFKAFVEAPNYGRREKVYTQSHRTEGYVRERQKVAGSSADD